MKYNHIACIIISLFSIILSGCEDDFPIGNQIIGEGEGQLSATVLFQPLTGTLESSRATSGDAIKNINTLTVIVYKQKGEISEFYKLFQNQDLIDTKIDIVNTDMPSDIENSNGEHQAEEKSARATFKLPALPYGTYQIYVAANLNTTLTEEDVATPDKLKEITQKWDNQNISANAQMFGYFTPENDQSSALFQAKSVVLNNKEVKIHAWIKRLASKVTLVYDPSGLKESIWIYIHKATIKDIPLECPLGKDNQPSEKEQLITEGENIFYDATGKVISEDQYPNNSDFRNWMELDRSSGLKGAVDENNNTHSELDEALYFYENCQGDYSDDPNREYYNKIPNKDDVYTDQTEGKEGYKDNVPYGTYIEVEGFYISQNPANQSSGPIKYRFMLGKNTTYNYNAQRNHHYKLTLKFKGYANQPEWHIEYEEEDPDIFPPEYFYLPYIYNHQVFFPLRIVGNCTELKAQIVENNWAPYDSTSVDQVPPEEINTNDLPFRWNRTVYENGGGNKNFNGPQAGDFYYGLHNGASYKVYGDEDNEIYKNNRKVTPIWAGFLSLQVPSKYENGTLEEIPIGIMNDKGQKTGATPSTSTGVYTQNNENWYSNTYSINGLKDYFLGKGGYLDDQNNTPQHERTYETSDGGHGNGLNRYAVNKNADESRTYMIPMFTRPKAMIFISGFSGNNPYEAFQRKAVVRFTAKFTKTDGSTTTKIKEVPVYQVRRLVNPKGVWRSAGNTTPFHVQLTRQTSPQNINYTPFESYGPWKAYVKFGNKSHFTLTSTVGTQNGDTIIGNTGTNIDFYINFGAIDATSTECAVINIEYHGNTCQHTIFARHGFNKPIQVNPGGAYWSSYSVYSFESGTYNQTEGVVDATMTVNPLSMGTMFKRFNYLDGIRIINNRTWGPLISIGDSELTLTGGKSKKWADIAGFVNRDSKSKWLPFKAKIGDEERNYEVPSYEDFLGLLNENFGYGVLYSDGASSAATTTTDAFQFFDYDNNTTITNQGMRGVFVYNSSNGNQIFFPIGAFGIGRRTIQNTTEAQRGYLRYGAVANVLNQSAGAYNQYRPITYNLPASPGSIYWLKTNNTNGDNQNNFVAWDMNYFDMSFNAYDNAATFSPNGDAVLIKPIYKSTTRQTTR